MVNPYIEGADSRQVYIYAYIIKKIKNLKKK